MFNGRGCVNLERIPPRTPVELNDSFIWTKQHKLIPRSRHGVSGLGNITHSSLLYTSPATVCHYHRDIMEVFCVVKGRRECTVYSGNRADSYEFTGSEALIIFPDEAHISGSNGIDPCDMYALQFNLSEQDSFLGLSAENGRRLCAALRSLKNRHIAMTPVAFSLVKSAFDCFFVMTEDSRVEGATFLACFLYTLLHLPAVNGAPAGVPNDRILRVLDYIEENIAQPLPLAELADYAGYSLSRFKALFRQITGQTPAQYIAMHKVEQAKRMLRIPEKSITDIAYDLGWSSSNYFCAVFKKYTNLSPMSYRRLRIQANDARD